MPYVCDSMNECPGWEKSYRLLNEIVVPFKFCPWCGKKIKWDISKKEVLFNLGRIGEEMPAGESG